MSRRKKYSWRKTSRGIEFQEIISPRGMAQLLVKGSDGHHRYVSKEDGFPLQCSCGDDHCHPSQDMYRRIAEVGSFLELLDQQEHKRQQTMARRSKRLAAAVQ